MSLLVRLGATLLVAVAAGCATAPAPTTVAPSSAELRKAELASPSDGGVVLRLLVNHEAINPFMMGWRPIVIEREAAPGNEIALAANPDAASHSAVFAGALPPGRYRFVRLPAFACAYACQPTTIKPSDNFARFEIHPGRLTDLGAIVLGTAGLGGSNMMMLSIESRPSGADTAELVREMVPGLEPLLARPVRHWDEPAPAGLTPAQQAARDPSAPLPPAPPASSANTRLAAALGELAWRSSKGFTAPAETAEPGTFVHGSSVGVVYSRPGGGPRRAHNLAERAAIDTVLVASDGRWLAGGEYGLVKQSKDRGASWESVRGDLPFGLVVGLVEARGQVFAAVLRGSELRVLATDLATLGPRSAWRRVFAGGLDIARFWDAPQRPLMQVQGDRIALTLPSRQLAVIDLAAPAVRTLPLPGYVQFFEFGADSVMRCRCGSVRVDPYESRDFGQTWKALDVSRYWMLPAFRDGQRGVILQNAFAGASKLAWTTDGGASWTEGSPAVPHDLHHLRWSKDGKTVYAASVQGQFWVSRDDGRQWQKVP